MDRRHLRSVFSFKILSVILLSALFAVSFPLEVCLAETVIVPIRYRVATEVAPAVERLMSTDGRMSVDVRTNSLVITDTEDKIKEIRSFLKDYDREVQQVRIRVRFEEAGSSENRGVSAEGSISGDKWRVRTPGSRRDGIDVRLGDSAREKGRTREFFVTTMSGSEAYILAGSDVLYRERWVYLSRRYAGYVETVGLRRIESGMEVTPVVMGDRVDIEVMPRISHQVPGRGRETIRFTRAATHLTAPLGQWVSIGGTSEASNEVIREILKGGSRDKKSSMVIRLKVETY